MPCACVNNTSCNLPKVVPELEIPAPRGKEWQCGVVGTQASWQYANRAVKCLAHNRSQRYKSHG